MKRSKTAILFGLLFFLTCTSSQQSKVAAPTLNQFQFSELDSLMSSTPRPLAIFLHAKWCQFCRNMEQTTLQEGKIIRLLNENYYFISFDGEQKEVIHFRENSFEYVPNGRNTGTHELANALGTIEGQLTYPTFVILNSAYEIVFQHNSFLNDQTLEKILKEGMKN